MLPRGLVKGDWISGEAEVVVVVEEEEREELQSVAKANPKMALEAWKAVASR